MYDAPVRFGHIQLHKEDRIEADGTVLIYEGHDEPRTTYIKEPKLVNQPRLTLHGRLTQNGQFEVAALEYKAGIGNPSVFAYTRRFTPAYGPTTECSTF